MSLVDSKSRIDSQEESKSAEVKESARVKLLGREFHTVEKGIDPADVVEYLKAATGSSEDAFQRLEQFSALQATAKSIQESISQARRLADYAKKQAELEARQKKIQAVEEAGRQAVLMIDRVRESCISSIDSTHGILVAAIREALEAARGTVAHNLTQISETIEEAAEERLGKWRTGVEQPTERPLIREVKIADIAQSDEPQEDTEIDIEKAVPDLISLHGSSTGLKKSDSSATQTAKVDSVTGIDEPSGLEDSPESEKDEVPAVQDSTGTDMVEASEGLYSGDVAIIIPRSAKDTWMQLFRNHLSRTPGVKIRGETERDKERIEVMLSLEKPTELLPLLQDLPNVRKVMEAWNGGKPLEERGPEHTKQVSDKSEEVALILQFA
jgi:hypothetical protein